MAHIWRIDGNACWAPFVLDGVSFALDASGPTRSPSGPTDLPDASAVIVRRGGDADLPWSVLVPPGVPVFVNGLAVLVGMAALSDRDEIRLPDSRSLFFSTETLATVAPFQGDRPHGFCPRCKQQIDPDTPAVKCPRCSLWYHQSDALPCWTYAERCAACAQATALDAGFSWTPEEV